MRILQILNQSVHNSLVEGDTGYASYINDLTGELLAQGHQVEFLHLSYPVSWNQSEWLRDNSDHSLYDNVHANRSLYEHVVLHDDKLGNAMSEKANNFDLVIVHATTSVPDSFVKGLTTRMIVVIHDPVFCNVTYGKSDALKKQVPWRLWNLNYLFSTAEHWVQCRRVYASWFDGAAPMYTVPEDLRHLFRSYSELFKKATLVVCPSVEVQQLLAHLWITCRTEVIPHPIPSVPLSPPTPPNLKNVVSVASWDKVDWKLTLDTARYMLLVDPEFRFYVVCSDHMAKKIEEYGKPGNVLLVPYMSRKDFFQFIVAWDIGQCIHLTQIFETFSYVPYEMESLGIRTILLDNGSGTTTAVKACGLENFKVAINVNYSQIADRLRLPASAWAHSKSHSRPLSYNPYSVTEYTNFLLRLAQ